MKQTKEMREEVVGEYLKLHKKNSKSLQQLHAKLSSSMASDKEINWGYVGDQNRIAAALKVLKELV